MEAYVTTAEDHSLSPTEKLRFFHNLFRGDALRLYYTNIKDRFSMFGEAVRAVYMHFNSPDV